MTQPRLPGPLGRLQDAISRSGDHPAPKLPSTVSGGMGTVPAAPINTAAPLPAAVRMSPAQAQRLMNAELLDAARSLTESTTELAARLGRRGAVNSVLEVWAGTIPTTGIIARTYEVAAGCIVINNLSAANRMTVQSGVAAGDTGGQAGGVGVQYVRANSQLVVPLADHSFLLTGTAADLVSFQVYTGLQPFGVQG